MTITGSGATANLSGLGLCTVRVDEPAKTTVRNDNGIIWQHTGWIDGWNRQDDDVLHAALDLDGDGSQEIPIVNLRTMWTGVLKWSNGALHVPWASASPIDGWNRSNSDRFLPADVDGDGRQEIVIANNDDGWTGVLKWESGALRVVWASPSPIDQWNRHADYFTSNDIDQDGCDEVAIANFNDGWLGVLKWENGRLHVLWASPSPITGPAGSCDVKKGGEIDPWGEHGIRLVGTDDEKYFFAWERSALQLVAYETH